MKVHIGRRVGGILGEAREKERERFTNINTHSHVIQYTKSKST